MAHRPRGSRAAWCLSACPQGRPVRVRAAWTGRRGGGFGQSLCPLLCLWLCCGHRAPVTAVHRERTAAQFGNPKTHTPLASPPPPNHTTFLFPEKKKKRFIHCVHNGDPLFPPPSPPQSQKSSSPSCSRSQIPEPGLLRPLREIR